MSSSYPSSVGVRSFGEGVLFGRLLPVRFNRSRGVRSNFATLSSLLSLSAWKSFGLINIFIRRLFYVLRAHHFSKGLRAPLKVNIQFKVSKVKIRFPDV